VYFGSKARRALWWNILIGTIPDCIIAVVAAVFFDGGVLLFVGIVVGLQVFWNVRWILGRIIDALVFALSGRRTMSSFLVDYLRENGFPEPQQYEDSAEGYLARVADDAKISTKIRLKAAAELGTLAAWRNLWQRGTANRLEVAYEDALVEYKRSFPPGKPLEDTANGDDDSHDVR
jgi:hypothetical protein